MQEISNNSRVHAVLFSLIIVELLLTQMAINVSASLKLPLPAAFYFTPAVAFHSYIPY
jgi:hypothetical protein